MDGFTGPQVLCGKQILHVWKKKRESVNSVAHSHRPNQSD